MIDLSKGGEFVFVGRYFFCQEALDGQAIVRSRGLYQGGDVVHFGFRQRIYELMECGAGHGSILTRLKPHGSSGRKALQFFDSPGDIVVDEWSRRRLIRNDVKGAGDGFRHCVRAVAFG